MSQHLQAKIQGQAAGPELILRAQELLADVSRQIVAAAGIPHSPSQASASQAIKLWKDNDALEVRQGTCSKVLHKALEDI